MRVLSRWSAPLWVRLGIPIFLIIALAVGLISFLNYYNFEKTYRQLNVSRITVVARELRQAIEAGLNVGLAPRNNTQLGKDLAIARDHTEGLRFGTVAHRRAGERQAGNAFMQPAREHPSEGTEAGYGNTRHVDALLAGLLDTRPSFK